MSYRIFMKKGAILFTIFALAFRFTSGCDFIFSINREASLSLHRCIWMRIPLASRAQNFEVMKKLTIVVPDDKMALVQELVKAINDMEIVEVKDMDSIEEFQRKSPMERLDFAICSVDGEKGLLVNRYDFAWLYAAVQHKLLKDVEAFHSVESFRQHLINIVIKNIPSNSAITGKYSSLQNKYPDWKFTDKHGRDANERQRRINVVKRFLSLYYKGK